MNIGTLTGKSVYTSRSGFKTKADAEIGFTRIKQKSTPVKDYNIACKKMYEEWIEIYKTTVRSCTIRQTKTLFRLHILPRFGQHLIKSIQTKDIQRAVIEWSESLSKYKSNQALCE